MFQIFLKTSQISDNDWNMIYSKIIKIANSFPLQLERLESYNGYSPELNKSHSDLIVDENTENEHISFWGDYMSYTAHYTIDFYKNWNKQKEKIKDNTQIDDTKPIMWLNPNSYILASRLPTANGNSFFYDYFDSNAAYRFLIFAIGILMENLLPGRAFAINIDYEYNDFVQSRKWLEHTLKQKFDDLIIFDEKLLINYLAEHYETKTDLVGRLDLIYSKKYKKNLTFAIENIGYKPALEYYTKVLASTSFGTFGFDDVLNPWIAATKDLEKTLELITNTKKYLISDKTNKRNITEAEKYDLKKILKNLLSEFILWTPEQRSFLEKFHTNKNELEGNRDDIFGTLMRLGGMRFDICPIYTTKENLFETFMYHSPKEGKEFFEIIEEWEIKNNNKYNQFVEEYTNIENKITDKKEFENFVEKEEQNDIEKIKLISKIDNYIKQYPNHEQFIVKQALIYNHAFMDIEKSVEDLIKTILEIRNDNIENINFLNSQSKKEIITIIKRYIKEKQHSINPKFESWINKIENKNILIFIYFCAALKIYDRSLAFARNYIFTNNTYWNKIENDKSIKEFNYIL